MLLARPGPSRTSPRTNSVRRPMRSRPHGLPRPEARARPQGGWSANGSVTSSRRPFASSCLTTSVCGTTSAGQRLTAERAWVSALSECPDLPPGASAAVVVRLFTMSRSHRVDALIPLSSSCGIGMDRHAATRPFTAHAGQGRFSGAGPRRLTSVPDRRDFCGYIFDRRLNTVTSCAR